MRLHILRHFKKKKKNRVKGFFTITSQVFLFFPLWKVIIIITTKFNEKHKEFKNVYNNKRKKNSKS